MQALACLRTRKRPCTAQLVCALKQCLLHSQLAHLSGLLGEAGHPSAVHFRLSLAAQGLAQQVLHY